MNNVVRLKPRLRETLRDWSYLIARGTLLGFCASVALLWLWPAGLRLPVAATVAGIAILTNAVAAGFYVQAVRSRREARRQIEAYEAAEARRRALHDCLTAPTVPLRLVVSQTTYRPVFSESVYVPATPVVAEAAIVDSPTCSVPSPFVSP